MKYFKNWSNFYLRSHGSYCIRNLAKYGVQRCFRLPKNSNTRPYMHVTFGQRFFFGTALICIQLDSARLRYSTDSEEPVAYNNSWYKPCHWCVPVLLWLHCSGGGGLCQLGGWYILGAQFWFWFVGARCHGVPCCCHCWYWPGWLFAIMAGWGALFAMPCCTVSFEDAGLW